jgi:serine/threonine-protein kinase RsbW
MDRTHELRLELPSRFDELELLDRLMDVFLEHAGVDEDARANLALAIREAAANAMLHGNALEARKATRVSAGLGPDGLTVEVADQGAGFDVEAVPNPLAPENLLKPTGRGILLMRNFMDEVVFEFPESGGTIVRLRKVLETAPSPRPEHSA